LRKQWNKDALRSTKDEAAVREHINKANAALQEAGFGGARNEVQAQFAGPWVEAMKLDNTKDRRDTMRDVADRYLRHRQKNAGLKLGGRSVASIRNALRQDNLMVLAYGLVTNDVIEGAKTAQELNDAIEAKYHAAYGPLKTVVLPHLSRVHDLIRLTGSPVFKDSDGRAEPETTTTTTKETTMTNATAIDPEKFFNIDPALAPMVNSMLSNIGLPPFEEVGKVIKDLQSQAARGASGLTINMGEGMKAKGSSDGSIPSGKPVSKKAKDILGLSGPKAVPFDFDVPCWEWDAPHPYVPAIDEAYQFQPTQVMTILMAIVTNQRTWLYGDTGCGKTTLVEQIAARMNYPVVRVNLDSEITRMDLIGAKDIVVDDKTGHTITTFTEGVLPWAMQQPCIFLADELDFIRADVAYVFQRALEGNGLTLTEDSGRVIHPHSGFRIIATGNTQGNGDETGRYQGAKPQSAAFLDRFTVWMQCDYMKPEAVEAMLTKKFPKLGGAATILAKYAREHWVAFGNAEILTPLSPRGLISCATTYTVYRAVMDDEKALKQAMKVTFSDRASREDAQTITGLLERVMKS
jgi:cobaltochelatase CobS subunit